MTAISMAAIPVLLVNLAVFTLAPAVVDPLATLVFETHVWSGIREPHLVQRQPPSEPTESSQTQL